MGNKMRVLSFLICVFSSIILKARSQLNDGHCSRLPVACVNPFCRNMQRWNNGCHRFATCERDPETDLNKCMCQPGFVGDGKLSCTESGSNTPFEDNHCTGGCDPNARCMPTYVNINQQLLSCVCNHDYVGNGKFCIRRTIPNDLPPACRNCHPTRGRCMYNIFLRRYHCACRSGYRGNGVTCSSVSTTTTTTTTTTREPTPPPRCLQVCHSDANCVLGSGSIGICMCKSGYFGDGINICRPDECSLTCIENAHCEPQEVTDLPPFKCVCDYGYRGNPHSLCLKWPNDNTRVLG
uniref:Stabilin-2-like n=1 Tax=Ciona intestinalis TaxID=7719 RepID=F7AN86_CIOIN|nr:stabilin-2-like [Ciona intestinalis]|eukprot:XP_009858924.2 stabilin-2-like [Ciona intestinalis]